jgi:hypothetical protein
MKNPLRFPWLCLAVALLLGLCAACVAQPVIPSTPYTRDLMRSPDAAAARAKIGVGTVVTNVAVVTPGPGITTNGGTVNLAAWVTNKIPYVNVRDFGADPAVSGDDTAAFTNAVNYLNTNGGRLFIPAGYYNVSARLFLTGPTSPLQYGMSGGYQIVGESGTILNYTGNGGGTNCLFYLKTPRNVAITDLQITTTTAITNFTAIAMEGPSGANVKLQRLMIERAREAILGDDMTDIDVDVVAFNCNVGVATARSADEWRIVVRGQYGGPAVVIGYTNAIFPSVAYPGVNADNVIINLSADCYRAGDFGVPRAEVVIRCAAFVTITSAYTEANASGSTATPMVEITNHFGGTPVVNITASEALSKTNGHVWLWSPSVVRLFGNSMWDNNSGHASVVFKTTGAQSGSYVHSDGTGALWFTTGARQYGSFSYNPGALYIEAGNVQDSLGALNGILYSTRGVTNVNGRVAFDVGFTGTDNQFARTSAVTGLRIISSNGTARLVGYGNAAIDANLLPAATSATVTNRFFIDPRTWMSSSGNLDATLELLSSPASCKSPVPTRGSPATVSFTTPRFVFPVSVLGGKTNVQAQFTVQSTNQTYGTWVVGGDHWDGTNKTGIVYNTVNAWVGQGYATNALTTISPAPFVITNTTGIFSGYIGNATTLSNTCWYVSLEILYW